METKMVCPKCKSENIVRDACATWDGTEWVLSGLYDNITCQDCGAEFYEAMQVNETEGVW